MKCIHVWSFNPFWHGKGTLYWHGRGSHIIKYINDTSESNEAEKQPATQWHDYTKTIVQKCVIHQAVVAEWVLWVHECCRFISAVSSKLGYQVLALNTSRRKKFGTERQIFWSRRACVRHPWWRTKRSSPLFSPTFFLLFLFSTPSAFHLLRGYSGSWSFIGPHIFA